MRFLIGMALSLFLVSCCSDNIWTSPEMEKIVADLPEGNYVSIPSIIGEDEIKQGFVYGVPFGHTDYASYKTYFEQNSSSYMGVATPDQLSRLKMDFSSYQASLLGPWIPKSTKTWDGVELWKLSKPHLNSPRQYCLLFIKHQGDFKSVRGSSVIYKNEPKLLYL